MTVALSHLCLLAVLVAHAWSLMIHPPGQRVVRARPSKLKQTRQRLSTNFLCFGSSSPLNRLKEALAVQQQGGGGNGGDENFQQRFSKGGKPPDNQLGQKDPDAHKHWTDATTPFEVVKYYARDGVSDEEIQALLDENEITSLTKLKVYAAMLGPVIRIGTIEELIANVNAALERTKAIRTGVLAGELDFDPNCIAKESLNLFASAAVSVKESCPLHQDRTLNFTIVMGPSGSGKTVFCLQELPTRVFPMKALNDVFRIHLRACTLLGNEPNDELDLAARLVNYVRETLARRLAKYVTSNTDFESIDLFLFIIIDEAGRTEYKRYLDKANKIESLVTALRTMDDYKFTDVHVTVTGTSLETSTQTIDSVVETVKFRMQPWSRANFHALLTNLKRSDENAIRGIVERFPVLNHLTTNARCAFFLARSMPNLLSVNEEQWSLHVEASVALVAQCYISSNGLVNLKNIHDKFVVVQEVFKAVDKAMLDSTDISFPSFDHIQDRTVRSAIQMVLNFNVEIKNEEAKLIHQGERSVSITPAIAIVLPELLCRKARINWSWRGSENAAAIGEWKKMITEMKATDCSGSCGVIYLQTPVLAYSADVTFAFPLVGRSTVYVNGPMDTYADVIAPFRFLQTKFAVNVNQDISVNFAEAMDMMGLTKRPAYRLNQAATSVFYKMWQTPHTSGNDSNGGRIARLDRCEGGTSEHCPFETLLFMYAPARKTARFIIQNKKAMKKQSPGVLLDDIDDVSPDDNDVEATNLINATKEKRIIILETFSKEQPVTAVFVTNAHGFVLKHQRKDPITITRGDVDWQGVLKKPLPRHLTREWRKHVNVRFMFYGQLKTGKTQNS